MNSLPFGCSYTDVWVSPANWETISAKKALTVPWYVQCNYYDPRFKDKYPTGKPIRKKLNRDKDLEVRRESVTFFLEELPRLFEKKGFNPITKEFRLPPVERVNLLNPELSAAEAFKLAGSKVSGSDTHKNEVRIAVNRLNAALPVMELADIKIKDLKYGQLSDALDSLDLSPNYYNKFRTYFIAVFKVLRKHECCTANLASELDKKKEISKPREVLKLPQVKAIFDYLQEQYPTFYRYANIFFCSGTRNTELLSVQKKHVRLDKQEYDVLIKKGNQEVWETKVILHNSLHLWKDLLSEAGSPEDYIFSKNLRPGSNQINPKQVSKRWRVHVKNKMAFCDCQLLPLSKCSGAFERITADIYSLKHSFLDLLDEKQSSNAIGNSDIVQLISEMDLDDDVKSLLISKLSVGVDFDVAQIMAAHRTVSITNKVYKVNKRKRENEVLKNMKIDLFQK